MPILRSRSLPGSSPAGAVGLAGVPGDQDALIADGQQAGEWGGWGSNPRPADYEKPGPALWARYLHGCHEVVPPMALIALFAPMARSTNRSTIYSGR